MKIIDQQWQWVRVPEMALELADKDR